MKKSKAKFSDIIEAMEYVSAAPPMEHEAYLCRETGEVRWYSEHSTEAEPLPDDIKPSKYVFIPHKNDLNLGKPLALKFVAEVLPDAVGRTQAIFSRPGAYARFKDLLSQVGKLEQWYEYEKQAQERELRIWCELNNIVLMDESHETTDKRPADIDPDFPGCGEYCPICVYHVGEKTPHCPGCRKVRGRPFWGECAVYKCFTKRGQAHCGLCGEFPCDTFIDHYEKSIPEGQRNAVTKAGILAYRARHGDAKTLALLKKIGFQSGK